MHEDGMTGLRKETLQEGLSRRRGRPVRVREFCRQFFIKSSTFWAEQLRVRLDGGESLEVFFKDLNPRHQIEAARRLHKTELELGYRELQVYRQILSRERFGTPQLYAYRWDPPGDVFWLFLEHAGDTPLNHVADFDLWLAAARWAARFHAATRQLPAAQTACLPRYDHAYYQGCAQRIRRKLPDLTTGDRPVIQRALDYHEGQSDWFGALPQSVIHGEFFGKNIVVGGGGPDRRLAVVDWETAAVGPSYLDLVSLSSGRWSAQQKQALWDVYFEQYRADTGLPLDRERFGQDLVRLGLHHALKRLGALPDWNFRHGIGLWVRELERALAG
jgi:hypothetical protein